MCTWTCRFADDEVAFVVEPELAVPAQHSAGRVEVSRIAHCCDQPLILDLRDISRRIPCGQQRGCADRSYIAVYFVRQRVHFISKQGLSVCQRVKAKLAG